MHLKNGFTLFELLIVMLIISLFFSVVLPPVSTYYEKYRGYLYAEKLVLYIAEKKRNAFLYGEDIKIYVKNNILHISNGETYAVKEGIIEMERPINLFSTGTTDGGKIFFYYKHYTYIIEIHPPFANLSLDIK